MREGLFEAPFFLLHEQNNKVFISHLHHRPLRLHRRNDLRAQPQLGRFFCARAL